MRRQFLRSRGVARGWEEPWEEVSNPDMGSDKGCKYERAVVKHTSMGVGPGASRISGCSP